ARSLGYLVVGINEYYTSQKCPDCHNFIARVTIRQLYCTRCCHYHHRDVMAAENMVKIVRQCLETQTRPLHLQPVTKDGRHPWLSESTEEQGDGKSKATRIRKSNQGKRSVHETGTSPAGSSSTSGKPHTSKRQRIMGQNAVAVDTSSSSEMGSSTQSAGPSKTRRQTSFLDLNLAKEL
ncbi:hypothetical protein EDD11_000482, partial [Mortierella claussenii]